ncbi:MAG TPA: MerR family transcriptional regulator [Blastocatellia bacterium]|jgi:DNA-binding transcriptional MerR regulator|nr:MerR family transcriptional regulator [Blastocatellia bacterium]
MELASRIPEKLFFKIGEVCELIKVQPHVLRYWETEFPMLAPQKNRAGQRVYRRKDVEMVMRIRDLLYEEKFTIAGAKKKLMDEQRGGSSRAKVSAREPAPVEEPARQMEPVPQQEPPPQHEPSPPPPIAPPSAQAAEQVISPQARRAIRVIKHELEGLLTMLNSDASIRN